MPRARPSMVQEHRITLGDYERKQLEEAITAANADQDLRIALDVVNMLALPVAIGAAGFFVYRGMNGWGTGRDKIAEWWNNRSNNDGTVPLRGGPQLIGAITELADVVNSLLRGGGRT